MSTGKSQKKVSDTGRSQATRIKIMKAAEKLFGDNGIEGVALREVSTKAGQKNPNSVQYHFGGRLELLDAIFVFRETRFQPIREEMLAHAEEHNRTDDVRYLLRICFLPYLLHYKETGEVSFIKMYAAYLQSQRPHGVPHPFDKGEPCLEGFRRANRLLRERLYHLEKALFDLRVESIAAMYLSTLVTHFHREPHEQADLDVLFEDVLGMMTAAIMAPPYPCAETRKRMANLP